MNCIPKSLTLPPETKSGAGAIRQLLPSCNSFGSRGMVVCGRSLEKSGRLMAILGDKATDDNIQVWIHGGGEPTLDQVEIFREDARNHKPDWVAAIGGGSVMDLAKAGAGLLNAPLSAVAYHEGAAIPHSNIPFLVAPTTAGTGSEATMVSVLTNTETGVKKSIRHSSFMATTVILDSALLDGCPKEVIAASGMDAFTQAIESYCSVGATWLTDALALKAAALIHNSLEAVYNGDGTKQEDLLQGSYLAGIALSNARLGIVHGLAHPLGARFHVPHGLACALCLPLALAFNRDAVPEKYRQLSLLAGVDIFEYVQRLLANMNLINPFSGETISDMDAVIEETLASGSTKANPRKATEEDVALLLEQLFASAPQQKPVEGHNPHDDLHNCPGRICKYE
ncbi:MAG TPA: iron-containing alcohol dehydrogenase [Candidatus Hydrogenedentes bacterium]|nr:iron-containing alcohol dehydrogenase [Candidatus Hydrogenedentota bacterium]